MIAVDFRECVTAIALDPPPAFADGWISEIHDGFSNQPSAVVGALSEVGFSLAMCLTSHP
jgi:hypothetical protein